MGNLAPDTLIPNPSVTGKSGVYWTQFPADALTGPDGRPVDWTNPQQAHRAVSRLFAPRLPGDADVRRAAAGILFRVDQAHGQINVLVQSLVAPELTPPNSRTTEVSSSRWHFEAGDRVAFRLAVSPIKRVTIYRDGGTGRHADGTRDRSAKHQVERPVSMSDFEPWLVERLGGSLGDIDIVSHYRDTGRSGKHRVIVDTIDALATVTDADAFDRIRIHGVGRAKSYGCGLLTATRLP